MIKIVKTMNMIEKEIEKETTIKKITKALQSL
jgi:hypothetical protein